MVGVEWILSASNYIHNIHLLKNRNVSEGRRRREKERKRKRERERNTERRART